MNSTVFSVRLGQGNGARFFNGDFMLDKIIDNSFLVIGFVISLVLTLISVGLWFINTEMLISSLIFFTPLTLCSWGFFLDDLENY